jgi:uncharacterized protein (TIGR02145 family)
MRMSNIKYHKVVLLLTVIIILLVSCEKTRVPGENEFMDPRDQTIYKTVQFGNKIWMAENLAYLPYVDSAHVESDTIAHYYIYDYEDPKLSIAKQTTNYYTYGVLYNFAAAIDACPDGWHLPSDYEWKDLELFFGLDPGEAYNIGYRSSGDVGEQIKSPYGWEGSGYGIDQPGFNAKAGGRRIAYSGTFLNIGTHAFFWTSTLSNPKTAGMRYLEKDSTGIFRSEGSVKNGFSVRCVRD